MTTGDQGIPYSCRRLGDLGIPNLELPLLSFFSFLSFSFFKISKFENFENFQSPASGEQKKTQRRPTVNGRKWKKQSSSSSLIYRWPLTVAAFFSVHRARDFENFRKSPNFEILLKSGIFFWKKHKNHFFFQFFESIREILYCMIHLQIDVFVRYGVRTLGGTVWVVVCLVKKSTCPTHEIFIS